MADPAVVLADLAAEGDELQALVADLDASQWARGTPAEGWTVAHQIAHLAWTDGVARLAVLEPVVFREVQQAQATSADHVDQAAADGAAVPVDQLLAGWRSGRAALHAALSGAPANLRIPWFGPPMGVASMATARLMETWAHGQDVADALGVTRQPTARLRHVAHIGVRTRDFAYTAHDRPAPAQEFRVELTGPAGQLWTWGPADAEQRVTGPGLDFCLLVTQRRHRDDLAVHAVGADADAWLDIAQAFAGRPGAGRAAAPVPVNSEQVQLTSPRST